LIVSPFAQRMNARRGIFVRLPLRNVGNGKRSGQSRAMRVMAYGEHPKYAAATFEEMHPLSIASISSSVISRASQKLINEIFLTFAGNFRRPGGETAGSG
jgi:hypothetical protein